MYKGALEISGTIDLAQFYPNGSSDGDTIKLKVGTGKKAFRFYKQTNAAARQTTVFIDGYTISGKKKDGSPQVKKLINSKGTINIRLQGVDTPELHYPIIKVPTPLKKAISKYLDSHPPRVFRQHWGGRVAHELGKFLKSIGGSPLPCIFRTAIDKPTDAVDSNGRFVGDVLVDNGRVNIGHWLIEHGWGVPGLYNSMSNEEIRIILDLTQQAWDKQRGIWKTYSDDMNRPDLALTYDDDLHLQPSKDFGPHVCPKFFRRKIIWEIAQAGGADTGDFRDFYAEHYAGHKCFRIDDFLKKHAKAKPVAMHTLLDDAMQLTAWPEEIVFKEDASRFYIGDVDSKRVPTAADW
jgi:endonuclease YncB( thermonuclease family)